MIAEAIRSLWQVHRNVKAENDFLMDEFDAIVEKKLMPRLRRCYDCAFVLQEVATPASLVWEKNWEGWLSTHGDFTDRR